ncbi:ATP-binding protein [Xanthomonas phaseoli]|uniref:ATP-binding protein n=2 Tax=Xanthomonas phaseoli TaxID=1985254 RepID=UPI00178C27DE|nr:ATP-binding protein [Xanthomonas phaseoli]
MSTLQLRLPSRYEDLDPAFRGRLRPNAELIASVQRAYQGMQMSGGIRFLPLYGVSGAGKSSAALELETHLPESKVVQLSRSAVQDRVVLETEIAAARSRLSPNQLLIAVVDQHEESVAEQGNIPTAFVESLALLDRGSLRTTPVLFIWLTTSRDFGNPPTFSGRQKWS